MKADVLIVGGGPAGLAAALALRSRGAEVTVADARKPPIDKACAEGLMPDSRYDLAQLGVTLSSEEGAPFRGIRFAGHSSNAAKGGGGGGLCVATAHFPAVGSTEAGEGIGLKRRHLHLRLMRQAEEAGVNLLWEHAVQLREGEVPRVAGRDFHYGWLVGADGHSSRVRRWAGLERGRILSRRFGFRQHFRVEPWSPYVEVYWGQHGQAYVTPVGPNEVCVATIARDPHCRLQTILNEIPWLRAKLAAGAAFPVETDGERGALTTTRRLERVATQNASHGRVMLIGDASGSADAITGEGMGMAFRQALLLAECIEKGDLERYNRLHPRILALPQTMARVMLWMDRSAAFRYRALQMLSAEPVLFARMLGVHLGDESLLRFVTRRGLQVAWRMAMQPGQAPVPLNPA